METLNAAERETKLAALKKVMAAMQKLLDDEQSNAYQLGTCANRVVDEGLVFAGGYRSSKHCFEKELRGVESGKISSLYRYARVAKSFSESDAKQFGVTKLDILLTYHFDRHNERIRGDLTSYEVTLHHGNGTTTTKKFGDCSVSELRRELKRYKQEKRAATPSEAPASDGAITPPALSLGKPTTSEVVASTPVQMGSRRAIETAWGFFVLGVLVGTTGGLIQPRLAGTIVEWIGTAISLSALGILARRWVKVPEEWARAFQKALAPAMRGFERLRSMTRQSPLSRIVDPTRMSSSNDSIEGPTQKAA